MGQDFDRFDWLTAAQKKTLQRLSKKVTRLRDEIGEKRTALVQIKDQIEGLLETVYDGIDHLDRAIDSCSELA